MAGDDCGSESQKRQPKGLNHFVLTQSESMISFTFLSYSSLPIKPWS